MTVHGVRFGGRCARRSVSSGEFSKVDVSAHASRYHRSDELDVAGQPVEPFEPQRSGQRRRLRSKAKHPVEVQFVGVAHCQFRQGALVLNHEIDPNVGRRVTRRQHEPSDTESEPLHLTPRRRRAVARTRRRADDKHSFHNRISSVVWGVRCTGNFAEHSRERPSTPLWGGFGRSLDCRSGLRCRPHLPGGRSIVEDRRGRNVPPSLPAQQVRKGTEHMTREDGDPATHRVSSAGLRRV